MKYQDKNSTIIDQWVTEGWEWGTPVSHETFIEAQKGNWDVLLTPNKKVPKDWFLPFKGLKILGLASGGGQQMPIFTALGASCTVLDYSKKQLESEDLVSKRENYNIKLIHADMTEPLPFEDGSFDFIFHPVSNIYIEKVEPVFKECYRVLRKGGIMIGGFDNGIGYIFDEDEKTIRFKLPFNPLVNKEHHDFLFKTDSGYQFSHTLEEQIGGQLKAGFRLLDLYEDTYSSGPLFEYNVPLFVATKMIKD
ncbi:MAG: class I SAM-dependent methyltransferase [Acholeplasmataceae bacterium]|nr:class I SAM-dependent methyltransferase [Acholeplasmataceae bacterium]